MFKLCPIFPLYLSVLSQLVSKLFSSCFSLECVKKVSFLTLILGIVNKYKFSGNKLNVKIQCLKESLFELHLRSGPRAWPFLPRVRKVTYSPLTAACNLSVKTKLYVLFIKQIVLLPTCRAGRRSGWLSVYRRCLPSRWPGFDSRSRPDLRLVWKSGSFL
jgi:hypothetical protein